MIGKGKKNYTVELTGRAGLTYSEGERKLFVDTEMLAGSKFDIVIYLSSVSFWTSPTPDAITDTEKDRIRSNISKSLVGQRIDWQ